MIDSSKLRIHYQGLCLDPIIKIVGTCNISPTTLTLTGCTIGLLIAPLLALEHNSLGLAALLLSGFFDTLDGALARHSNTSSPQGACLDIVSDRLVEFSVILGLFLIDPQQRGFLCLLMLGSVLLCVTSFLVIGIFEKIDSHKSFYYSPGIMERTEAFLFFSLMIVWPNLFSTLATLFTGLVFLTAIIRVVQFFTNRDKPIM